MRENPHGGKAGQQPYQVQILDPLAVGYVALASGHTLQIVCVDQRNFEPALMGSDDRVSVPVSRTHERVPSVG